MKNELFSSFEWNISQKVSQQEWNYRSFDSRQNRHWSGSYWGTGESHTEVIAKFKCLISMSSNMLHRFIKPFLSPTIKFSFKGQKHEIQEGRLEEQIFKINGRICETFDLCKSLGLLNLARKQQHYTPFTWFSRYSLITLFSHIIHLGVFFGGNSKLLGWQICLASVNIPFLLLEVSI